MGMMCDAGCKTVFTYTNVQIIKDEKIILTEIRDKKLDCGEYP